MPITDLSFTTTVITTTKCQSSDRPAPPGEKDLPALPIWPLDLYDPVQNSSSLTIGHHGNLTIDTGFDALAEQVILIDPPKSRLHTPPIGPHLSSLTHQHSISISSIENQSLDSMTTSQSTIRMPKKRRSLQRILVPSFFQIPPLSSGATSPLSPKASPFRTRARSSTSQSLYYYPDKLNPQPDLYPVSTSSRASPPPDFLLDDDPFANLSSPIKNYFPLRSAPSVSPAGLSRSESTTPTPRSPLSPTIQTNFAFASVPSSPREVSSHGVPRVGFGHSVPAHKKPAFAARPSLPSLHTLSRTDAIVPKKVRKGRVGARLPSEPWDMDLGDFVPPASPATPSFHQNTHEYPIESGLPAQAETVQDPIEDLDSMPEHEFSDSHSLDAPDACERSPPFDYHEIYDTYASYSPVSDHSFDVKGAMYSNSDEESDLVPSLTRTPSSGLSSTSLSRSGSTSSFSSFDEAPPPSPSPSSPMSDRERRSLHRNVSLFGGITHLYRKLSLHQIDLDIISPHLSAEVDCFSCIPSSSTAASSTLLPSNFSSSSQQPRPESTTVFPAIPETDDHGVTSMPSMATIRGTVQPLPSRQPSASEQQDWMTSAEADSGEAGQGEGGDRQRSGSSWSESVGGDAAQGRVNGGGGSDNPLRGSDDQGDEDDDDRPYGDARSTFSTPTDSSESDSEENEEHTSTDDYGADTPNNPSITLPASTKPGGSSGSDDDVPLARRIPTALEAQRTIRQQVRAERDRRRRDKAAARENGKNHSRERHTTLRPAGTGDRPSHQQAAISSSQEAALHATQSVKRERTKTLPGTSSVPFAVEDLTKKLLNVQVAGSSGHRLQRDHFLSQAAAKPRISDQAYADDRLLLPAPRRSQDGGDRGQSTSRHTEESGPPLHRSKSGSGRFLGRSVTVQAKMREPAAASSGSKPRSFPTHSAMDDSHGFERVIKSGRRSEEGGGQVPNGTTSAGQASTRTSGELDRATSTRKALHRPRVPPLPSTEVNHPPAVGKSQSTQQRIFVGDMQTFNMVEVGPSTNAGDVVEMVEGQGTLKQWVGTGEWMLFEIAQDFGLERPIRSFELLSEISASWNKDKTTNMFLVKLTPLSSLLRRSAIPTSSPTHSGYLEWESKRGKWNKRYMILKEHSLWLSKRDSGKEEIFLCSLSNFDAYTVSRLHKAPKEYVFALKSTENLSLFENKADYLHVFSCGRKDGEKWMEKILLARSYVLQQERQVLFARTNGAGVSASTPAASQAAPRSRPVRKPTRPLVNVAAPAAAAPTGESFFEPGSLLSTR